MKKFLAIFLTLVLLTGCSRPTPDQSQETAVPEVTEPQDSLSPEDPADTPVVSEVPEVPEVPEVRELLDPLLPQSNYTAPGSRKEVKNILMVGNSFCYHYVEELLYVAYAAGYELTIANLYDAGCYMEEHWKWLSDPEEGKGKYSFFVTDVTGRHKYVGVTTLTEALAFADWDVITLQQHFAPGLTDNSVAALDSCTPYAENLYTYLRENHPKAELFWHETWAFQVGYNLMVDTPADQAADQQSIREASLALCHDNKVAMIPAGDAWELARRHPDVGDTLCKDDKYHDGDVGGGQYLNACVWFETIMGESCVGNTWRPGPDMLLAPYEIPEEKIVALQQCAHNAVSALYGEDYAPAAP